MITQKLFIIPYLASGVKMNFNYTAEMGCRKQRISGDNWTEEDY